MNVIKTIALLGICITSAAAAEGGSSESGVWVKRTYNLQYMGFTSTYSCDGLADKLRVLVKAAGARADVKSSAGACASGFGRADKFANANLTFYALVPVSQAKAEETTGTPVQGTWQTVEISPRKPRELQVGDCELVEQFQQHVLPLLTQRIVSNKITCVPNQQSGTSYQLSFEVFKPADGKQP